MRITGQGNTWGSGTKRGAELAHCHDGRLAPLAYSNFLDNTNEMSDNLMEKADH